MKNASKETTYNEETRQIRIKDCKGFIAVIDSGVTLLDRTPETLADYRANVVAELADLCKESRLYYSETEDPVTAEELGISDAEYRQAVVDSEGENKHKKHIRVNGRWVFANN
jgi:hypothetical protein